MSKSFVKSEATMLDAVVEAVRALHYEQDLCCHSCQQVWPCPTELAIREALGESDE